MAPDADKVRLRKAVLTTGQHHNAVDSHGEETVERLVTLKGLRGNEVCIDGVIYDITSFDHPGGDTIRVFGGNDATTQYKMIHPYHTSKHLEKMKVVDASLIMCPNTSGTRSLSAK